MTFCKWGHHVLSFPEFVNKNKLLHKTDTVLSYCNKIHINVKFLLSRKVLVSSRTQGVVVLNVQLFYYQRLVIF